MLGEVGTRGRRDVHNVHLGCSRSYEPLLRIISREPRQDPGLALGIRV